MKNHSNLLKYKGSFYSNDSPIIVMENTNDGSLFDYV